MNNTTVTQVTSGNREQHDIVFKGALWWFYEVTLFLGLVSLSFVYHALVATCMIHYTAFLPAGLDFPTDNMSQKKSSQFFFLK